MTPRAAVGRFPYAHRTVAELEAACSQCGQKRMTPCAYTACPKRETNVIRFPAQLRAVEPVRALRREG